LESRSQYLQTEKVIKGDRYENTKHICIGRALKAMHISKLEWDNYRIDHVAKHDVEPYEVWEVCKHALHKARREGRNRYRIYGQTVEGRYLFVVLEHIEGGRYKPITARDMTDGEKHNYKRLLK